MTSAAGLVSAWWIGRERWTFNVQELGRDDAGSPLTDLMQTALCWSVGNVAGADTVSIDHNDLVVRVGATTLRVQEIVPAEMRRGRREVPNPRIGI